MSLTKLEKDLNIVSSLDNEPNDVGGLTSEELKAKFDEGSKAIQEYINETLIPETEAAVEEVRGEIEGAVGEVTENLEAQLRGVVLGQIPDGTITEEKLDPAFVGSRYTKEETDAAIEAAEKIGDIKVTLRDDLGEKWLLCDGTAIDAETYPELYAETDFSIYGNFEKQALPIAKSDFIVDIYRDEDCSVLVVRDSNYKNMYLYWKRNTETEWQSKTLHTVTGSNYLRYAKISLANNYICVLFAVSDTSFNNNKYVYCSKDDFAWSDYATADTYDNVDEEWFTPIRYLNGYYVYASSYYGNSEYWMKIHYKADITDGASFSAGTYGWKYYSWPVDITYADGRYEIMCGYSNKIDTVYIAYTDTLTPSTYANGTSTNYGKSCATNFVAGTNYWATNASNGYILLMKGTAKLATIGVVDVPQKIEKNGDVFYIACNNCFVEYDLVKNSHKQAKYVFENGGYFANNGYYDLIPLFMDFANGLVSIARENATYFELKKALPRHLDNGAKVYIKAKN